MYRAKMILRGLGKLLARRGYVNVRDLADVVSFRFQISRGSAITNSSFTNSDNRRLRQRLIYNSQLFQ